MVQIIFFSAVCLLALAAGFLVFWATLKIFQIAGAGFKKTSLVFGAYLLATIVFSALLSFASALSFILSPIAGALILYYLLKKFFGTKFWRSVAIYFVFYIFLILASLAMIVPVRMFVVEPFYMKGVSMEMTYQNDDYLLINKFDQDFRRGDVIVFHYPENYQDYFIQRIVGMPGENVAIKNGNVYINGVKFSEPYLAAGTETIYSPGAIDVKLGSDQYYVLGDNRDFSKDSRVFGPLDKRLIVGKVWFKGWPPK
jgi:signal peptidase I